MRHAATVFLITVALPFVACGKDASSTSSKSKAPAPMPEVTVSLTAGSVNVEVDEDSSVKIAFKADVENSGEAPKLIFDAGPRHGKLEPDGATAFVYTPEENFNGSETIKVRAEAGAVSSASVVVRIAVLPVNDPPSVASAGVGAGPFYTDSVMRITPEGWSDIDGDAPSYRYRWEVNGLAVADTASILSDASFMKGDFVQGFVTPFDGTDEGDEVAGNLVEIANSPPIASPQSATIAEDSFQTAAWPATDADGDALTAEVVSAPTNGTADELLGNYRYTPVANYYGSDSFAYRVSDGTANSNVASITLTVTPVNDLPRPWPLPFSTPEDTPYGGMVTATDIESAQITYSVYTQPPFITLPSKGTVAIAADGSFTYTPYADVNGTDSFWYSASDGEGLPVPAVVNVTISAVNDAPVVSGPVAIDTLEDTPYSALIIAADIDNVLLGYEIVTAPTHGTVSLAAGAWLYTPDANFFGNDSFSFRATDGTAYSNTLDVPVTVTAVNDVPIAWPAAFVTDEDTPFGGAVTASDVESSTFTYAVSTQTTKGTVVMATNGTFTFTPNLNANGSDSFWFTANDGVTDSTASRVSISITPVNDPPVLAALGYGLTVEDIAYMANVTATDPDNVALTFEVAEGAGGTVALVDASTGAVEFTPTPGYAGAASYSVRVTDGAIYSSWAVQSLWIKWRETAGVGRGYACGVSSPSGSLYCWGSGQPVTAGLEPVLLPLRESTSASNWISVGSGRAHTCAIDTNLDLYCWGQNYYGEVGVGVASSYDAPQKLAGTGWVSVTGGLYHTCAVKRDATLWCWGDNLFLQVGISGADAYATPVQVPGSDWMAVSSGEWHTCAVKFDGTVWCWGRNPSERLAIGSAADLVLPSQVVNAAAMVEIGVGSNHSCAVKNDGSLWCWGGGGANQANGSPTYDVLTQATRVGTAADWRSVAGGASHSCATKQDGTLWCWGSSVFGETGLGFAPLSTPTQVGTATHWKSVDANDWNTCASADSGAVFCFGGNNSGQLGIGKFPERSLPAYAGTATWSSFRGTGSTFCGTKIDGSLWCWGFNMMGQFGNGQVVNAPFPLQVTTETGWSAAGAGQDFSCALKSIDGSIWCSGYNSVGQLGNSSMIFPAVEHVQEETQSAWQALSVGHKQACAIQADSTLWCWGDNQYGQLGTTYTGPNTCNGTGCAKAPNQVGADTGWSLIDTYFAHTCAIKTDGTLWCWGDNRYGQLGTDSTGPGTCNGNGCAQAPIQVGSYADWVSVATGEDFTCGIRDTAGSRTLWCWGRQDFGELATGMPGSELCGASACEQAPVQEATGVTTWDSIYAGFDHACATRTDGSLWCWGSDDSGQVGVGDGGNVMGPVQVDASGPLDWGFVGMTKFATLGLRGDALWSWGRGLNGELADGGAWSAAPMQVPLP